MNVSVAFFSVNVPLTIRKEFHACNNDPTLRQLMPPTASGSSNNVPGNAWAQYCYAYA